MVSYRDNSASWTVDRALGILVTACGVAGIDVPAIVMVEVDRLELRLRLATPNQWPPAPWSPSIDSLTWTAALRDLEQAGPAASARPMNSLVAVGHSETARVLLDFGQARGIISVGGDPTARIETVREWIVGFGENPWSPNAPILLVGLGELATPATESVRNLDEALAIAGSSTHTGLIVVSQAPSGSRALALATAFESDEGHWPVIVVGPARRARWKFIAEPDGWVTSDFLPPVRSLEVALAMRRSRKRS